MEIPCNKQINQEMFINMFNMTHESETLLIKILHGCSFWQSFTGLSNQQIFNFNQSTIGHQSMVSIRNRPSQISLSLAITTAIKHILGGLT